MLDWWLAFLLISKSREKKLPVFRKKCVIYHQALVFKIASFIRSKRKSELSNQIAQLHWREKRLNTEICAFFLNIVTTQNKVCYSMPWFIGFQKEIY